MYIVFEGSDGVGKSTQIELLSKRLTESGFSVICTREPTDGPWGKMIKSSTATKELLPDAETLSVWFSRDRFDHLKGLVKPALIDNKVVIQDRYFLSTLAYQGETVELQNLIVCHSRLFCKEPTVWIILSRECSNTEKALDKRGARDGFEGENTQQIVRNRYLDVLKYCQSPIIIQNVLENDPLGTHQEIFDKLVSLNIIQSVQN